MAKQAIKTNVRRALDTLEGVQAEAESLIEDIERAAVLGALPPSASEVREFLDAVIDLKVKEPECDACGAAYKATDAFLQVCHGERKPAREALIRALQLVYDCNVDVADAVNEFETTVLRDLAIKWVSERAADFGQPNLAALVMKLEVL